MQFDFLPHSKLNLLLPKKYAMFLCPQPKTDEKDMSVKCMCVRVTFSNNFTLKFVTNCSHNGNLHKISKCVFVILPDSHFAFAYISPNDLHKNAASLTNFTCR